MVISKWDILKSYLYDVPLQSTSSVYNPELHLFLVRGKLQLCTPNAVYSYHDRYDNFGLLFSKHLDISLLKGCDALVLGLGLGSIPRMLDQMHPGHWQFTAVEIDEEICLWARECGLSELRSPIQIIVCDAARFIDECTDTYDLILMDIFLDEVIPSYFRSAIFLRKLKKLLAPGGLLIYNTLACTEKDRLESTDFFANRFKPVFPTASCIHVHRNLMLLSTGDLIRQ